MKKLICDRIEEGIAVLIDEEENQLRFPVCLFEDGTFTEGTVYLLSLEKDEEATAARRAMLSARLKALFKKGNNENEN